MPSITVMREIDPAAQIAPDVEIGPYCVIGPDTIIGPGAKLGPRVSVLGRTSIGSDNTISAGCVLGAIPQDLKYAGGATLLTIGHRNRLNRRVTAHIGTESGGYVTRIGNDNVLLDGAHVAHDCYVDDHVHLGRDVLLAGHCRVQTGAVIGDHSGLHHFATVGRYARVGARTPVRRDVPPFVSFFSIEKDRSAAPAVRGVHEAGLKAAKLSTEEEKDLRRAICELFEDETALQTKIEQLVNMGIEGEVAALCEFCQHSLQGVFGRYRELLRGKAPPEAAEFLPPELHKEFLS